METIATLFEGDDLGTLKEPVEDRPGSGNIAFSRLVTRQSRILSNPWKWLE